MQLFLKLKICIIIEIILLSQSNTFICPTHVFLECLFIMSDIGHDVVAEEYRMRKRMMGYELFMN